MIGSLFSSPRGGSRISQRSISSSTRNLGKREGTLQLLGLPSLWVTGPTEKQESGDAIHSRKHGPDAVLEGLLVEATSFRRLTAEGERMFLVYYKTVCDCPLVLRVGNDGNEFLQKGIKH